MKRLKLWALALLFGMGQSQAQKLPNTAKIRVDNNNIANIYSNVSCVDPNNKNVIHAAANGTGLSPWNKGPREGMPLAEGSPKRYSEYRVPANVPTVIEVSVERELYQARNWCNERSILFIPEASHNYEIWATIDVDKKSCQLIGRELAVFNNQVMMRPIPNAKLTSWCGEVINP